MKKSLLLIPVVAMSMSAAAQTSFLGFDPAALGITGTAASFEATKTLADDDNMTFSLLFTDNVKTNEILSQYPTIQVGDKAWNIEGGIQGNGNPKPSSAKDLPTEGFVIKITVKNDGWLTVPSKISPSKAYGMWDATAGKMMAYTMGGSIGIENSKFYYTLPATEEGYLDFAAADADTYLSGSKLKNVCDVITNSNVLQDADGKWLNVSGFLQCPVKKDNVYYVNAYGSKISFAGAFFTPGAAQPTVVMSGAELPEETFKPGTSAVDAVEVENADAPVYNMMGVRVNSDAKGILIQNGKKFIRK